MCATIPNIELMKSERDGVRHTQAADERELFTMHLQTKFLPRDAIRYVFEIHNFTETASDRNTLSLERNQKITSSRRSIHTAYRFGAKVEQWPQCNTCVQK